MKQKPTFLQYCVRGLMSGLALFMVALLAVVPMTGCTPAQVATFDSTVTAIEGRLPQLAQLATGITILVAPQYAAAVSPFATQIGSDIALVKTIVDGMNTSPDATTLQKLDSLAKSINASMQGIITAVGVKDSQSTADANFFAFAVGTFVGLIQDIVKAKSPAIAASLPHVFGWNIKGMHAIAYTTGDREADELLTSIGDSTAPGSLKKRPAASVRQIAKTWNALAKNHPEAKVKVPRARVVGVPIPFTGH